MGAVNAFKHYYTLFGARGVGYAVLARLLRRRSEVNVAVKGVEHPIVIRLRTTDSSILQQVWILNEYELPMRMDPEVIVDAGANIGLTSLYYANKFPRAKIYAIEPEPSNFRVLEINAKPYANIVPIKAAVWSECGNVRIVDSGLGHFGFQITRETSGERAESRTAALTIGSLMREYGINHIDILKMDVEGAEVEVFQGADEWIDYVGMLVIELHDRIKPNCTEVVSNATRNFETLGQRGETLFMRKASFLGVAPDTEVRELQEQLHRACRIISWS